MLDNKTILVLDDEELLLSYLVNDLRSAGYRAFGMESKRLGLHWMKEHRPDLVISDIYSPQMNGFEFINALKADPDLAHTPVIDRCIRSGRFRSGGQGHAARRI